MAPNKPSVKGEFAVSFVDRTGPHLYSHGSPSPHQSVLGSLGERQSSLSVHRGLDPLLIEPAGVQVSPIKWCAICIEPTPIHPDTLSFLDCLEYLVLYKYYHMFKK